MYTMKQTCEKTGMTYETLKFYCNEGLIPNVRRNENGHRIFDDRNVAWINSLSCLKNCGMSIGEMKIYLNLCLAGEQTIPERITILDIKKNDLIDAIHKITQAIDYIDHKKEFYNDVLSGKTQYFSNLINYKD